MPETTRLPASRVPLVERGNETPRREWFRFFEQLSVLLNLGGGLFYDTTSPTFAADTPTIIPMAQSSNTRSMSLAANRVTVGQAGFYRLTLTLQLTNADATNTDDFAAWLRVNGADANNSRRVVSVLPTHGGQPGSAELTLDIYRQFATGDTFEIYGLSKLGYANIVTYAASVSPAYPAAAGVLLTVTQIV